MRLYFDSLLDGTMSEGGHGMEAITGNKNNNQKLHLVTEVYGYWQLADNGSKSVTAVTSNCSISSVLNCTMLISGLASH